MAAPSTVYQTYKTRRRKAGTPDVDIDLFIAKFLQNTTPPSGDNWGDGYFNSTDTEAEKIAKIKGIFKIDGWVNADTPIQKAGTITISGTSVSGSGTAFTTDFVVGQKVGALVLTDGVLKCVETYIITAITSDTAMSVVAGTNRSGIAYANYHQGFIGYCNSRASGNGLYHNWDNNTSPFVARGSGVRVPTTVNASAELLNDAGLNRKGECSISAVTSDLENNAFVVTGVFRSSFYNATTAFGVKWSGFAERWTSAGGFETPYTQTRDINKTTIAPKIKITHTAVSYVEPITDPMYNLIAGEQYTITPYITNEEGRMEGTPIAHLMSGISAQMSFGATAADAAASTTFTTVYKWSRGLRANLQADGLEVQATIFDLTPNGSSGQIFLADGWWAYPAPSGSTIRLCVQTTDSICSGILYINTAGSGGGTGRPPIDEMTRYTKVVGESNLSQADAIVNARENNWQIIHSLQWSDTYREYGWAVLVEGELVWQPSDYRWICLLESIGTTTVVIEVIEIVSANIQNSSGLITVSKT